MVYYTYSFLPTNYSYITKDYGPWVYLISGMILQVKSLSGWKLGDDIFA